MLIIDSHRERKRERERKLVVVPVKRKERVDGENPVIRMEKERHIVYQDRTKRIEFE